MNKMPPIKGKMLTYTEEQMENALRDVRQGVPVAVASKIHNVPRITLMYKARGKTPINRRMGPDPTLTREEENIIVDWIETVAKAGFPVSKDQVLDSVHHIIKDLKRPNSFKNDRPGRKWLQSFLKRNPSISFRTAQNLTISRASVTEELLLNWYKEIEDYLKKKNFMDILRDGKRIFNGDETAFFLNPKGNKVLASKYEKNVHLKVNANEKECLTVLMTANACGFVAPPLVVFKYERIPQHITETVPKGWGIGKSESGWMTSALFYEYISNVFHPWLIATQITLPIIFFIDGHSSHLTLHTSKFCKDNGIILIALPPNATHLIQPMDVAVFRSLKEHWKGKVHQWRIRNTDNPILKKKDFSGLLEETIEETITPTMLANGFRKCGLFPWNPRAITLISTNEKETLVSIDTKNIENEKRLKTGLDVLEEFIGSEKLSLFKNTKSEWEGNAEDKCLYEIWKNIKYSINLNNKSIVSEIECVHEEPRIETDLDEIAVNIEDCAAIDNNNSTENNISGSNQQSDSLQLNSQSETSKPNIPSPFKNVLFFPGKFCPKKRSREKLPNVVSSDKWQEYHNNKLQKKLRAEELKRERAAARLKKKEDKLKKNQEKAKKQRKTKKKQPIISSSEDEDEWAPSGSSLDDVNIFDVDNTSEFEFNNNLLECEEPLEKRQN